MLHIDTTVLPHGERRDLFVMGTRFVAGPLDDALTIHTGGFALPGLVDAHAHLAIPSPAPDSAPEDETIRSSARAQLEAGVLAVREPGSPVRATRDVGSGVGMPRLQTAGRFLAGKGRYFRGVAREIELDELPAAVAEELEWSGHWAKVIGDFFDDAGDMSPVFPLEILREAADVAHTTGGRITMHAMTREGAELAIAAGFDAIEHGTMLDPDLIDEMARRSMTWVPTMSIAEPVREILTTEEGPAAEWLPAAFDRQPRMVRHAADQGVRVLAGTDAGMVPHGRVATEIMLLAACGLSNQQALAAGSWEARRYLGLPLVEPGAPADLVIYSDDPREDLSVLHHPVLILLDGAVVQPRR